MANKSLTLRQERFVDNLVQGKSMYKAAIDSGYTHNTGIHARKDILENPRVQAALNGRLGGQGWADLITQGLLMRLKSDKDYAFIKAVELWAKLMGAFQPEKQEVTTRTQEDRYKLYADIVGMIQKTQGNSTGQES